MTISNFVAYVKQAWKNKPDTSTPLSAARLTHLEDGIKGNSDAIEKIAAAVVSQIVNDPNKIASMASLYSVNQAVTQLNSDLGNRVINNNIDQKIKIGWTGTAAPLIVNDSYKGDFALKSDLGAIQIKSVLTIYKSGISITAGENTYVSLPYTKTYNAFPLVIVKSAVHCIVNIVDIKTDTVDVRLEGIKTDADGQVYLYVLEI